MADQIDTPSDLDIILSLQIMAAWAGEGMSEPGRLGWWRTDLVDEAGGGDLFRRQFSRTHRWAFLEAVRKAAIMSDARARLAMARPDMVRTLFFQGFDRDEKLEERLAFHKREATPPARALPFPVDPYTWWTASSPMSGPSP